MSPPLARPRPARAVLLLIAVLWAGTAGRSAMASAAAPAADAWAGWHQAWDRLDSLEVSARSLADLAGLDAARSALLDSLCNAAGGDTGSGRSAGEAGRPPSAGPAREWVRRTILETIFLGEPRSTRLLTVEWDPAGSRAWNDDGFFTLPAAALLLSHDDPSRALSWLETAAVPSSDEPYAAVLAAECRVAMGDTTAAARGAQARLAAAPLLPAWAREPLEETVIRGAVASADTAQARVLLAPLQADRDRRAFVLPVLRRLAMLRRDARAADSLAWRAAWEFPAGRTGGLLLDNLVSDDGRIDAAFSGRTDRVRILLAVAEARGEIARFRALARLLGAGTRTPRADSLAIRAARTAWRARDYEGIARLGGERDWRPGGPFATEYDLIVARALRNTGRIDSMAARYARVTRRGDPDDRRTALWEWAREMEAQRRFVEADSLYARYLRAGAGDQQAQAFLRRGICRVAGGSAAKARVVLERAAAIGSAEEREAAWFWIYRAELARGRKTAARAALVKAGETRGGYYGQRARSAVALARRAGGPSIDDPAAYWRAVSALGGDGADAPSPESPESPQVAAPSGDGGTASPDSATRSGSPVEPVATGPGRAILDADSLPSGAGLRSPAWTPPPEVRALRDQLLLFRLTGRTDWARMVREDLLAEATLGQGATRVQRLVALGLPDLAARAAGSVEGASPRLRHPFPYPAAVAAASRVSGVAPEWAWAVMRRESLYENAVVSAAGAVGLMQLVAATAEETSRRHGLPAGPLEAPRENLELGMAHLGDLARGAHGNWPFVLAAYNAGADPARRWLRAEEDADLYIEMIGYRETRDYVRRVLETFWTCRELLRGRLA